MCQVFRWPWSVSTAVSLLTCSVALMLPPDALRCVPQNHCTGANYLSMSPKLCTGLTGIQAFRTWVAANVAAMAGMLVLWCPMAVRSLVVSRIKCQNMAHRSRGKVERTAHHIARIWYRDGSHHVLVVCAEVTNGWTMLAASGE